MLPDERRQVPDQSVENARASLESGKIAAQQEKHSNTRRMSFPDEFRFDESIRHGETAIRIEADSCVVPMSHLVEWNLGRAVRRILCPAPVTVVGHQSFGEPVRLAERC